MLVLPNIRSEGSQGKGLAYAGPPMGGFGQAMARGLPNHAAALDGAKTAPPLSSPLCV